MKNIHHSTSGFTLTELLVSISIIGTLLGILLPTLAMAKAKVNRIKCVNNVGQVGKALLAFAADNSERMPWQPTPFAKTAHFGSQDPLSTRAIVSLQAVKPELGTAKILASPCDAETQGPNEAAQANWETYDTRTGNLIPLNAITYRFIKGGNTGRPGTMLAMTRNFSTDNLATGSLVGADEEKSHSSAVTGLKKDQGQAVFADGSARQITNQDIKATVKYHQSSCGGFVKGPASTIIIDGGISGNDLIAYYPFNEGSFRDESGYNNHGSPKAGAKLGEDRNGLKGEAVVFARNKSHLHIDSQKVLEQIEEPGREFTIALWVKMKSLPKGVMYSGPFNFSRCRRPIASNAASLIRNPFEYCLYIFPDGTISANKFLGSGKTFVGTRTLKQKVIANEWAHISCVFRDQGHEIYLNGVREDKKHIWRNYPDGSKVAKPLTFGYSEVFRQPMEGALDEIRFYGRALTGQDISEIYNLEKPDNK